MPEILEIVPKWATSSIRKAFTDRAKDIPVYFEEEIKTNNQDPFYFELRIDGPYYTPHGSSVDWKAYFEVNCLITLSFDEKDALKMTKLIGIALAALSDDICVYKYGLESYDNDNEYFGVLQLITHDHVQASNFGQINDTEKVYQATVEAHYNLEFVNGTI